MLIIHPFDKSTDFLSELYTGLDCSVIRNSKYSKSKLRSAMIEHEKVVFLGHGTEEGLLQTPIYGNYMISSIYVDILRQKECVYIWCNADMFVRKYKLSGFATGMIISEPTEAMILDISFTEDCIPKSNKDLAKSIDITKDKQTMFDNFIKTYPADSSVAKFNKQNIFVF